MIKSLQTSFRNESQIRHIIDTQENNGVKFNARRANRYISYIERKKLQLYQRIRPLLQLEIHVPYNKPVNKPFKKDGTYANTVHKWYGDQSRLVAGTFTRVEFKEPDLGSRTKLQSQLLRLGWEPRFWTEKGNPKLTHESQPCESLNKISSDIGQNIATWYVLSHRQSQIQGWLDRLRPSERLSARAVTIGTPTYRFRHSEVVNVPKADKHVPFGKQMRSLFTVPKGKVMVGHDASGLELRMLAHYLNNPEYTKVVTEQDPHEYHRQLVNLETRNQAKSFIYKFNYGAGGLLIGMSVYCDDDLVGKFTNKQIATAIKQLKRRANKDGMVGIGHGSFIPVTEKMAAYTLAGDSLKQDFLANNPGLSDLIKGVTEASERGYLLGLDGRRIQMRRDSWGNIQKHKALNTLMQSAGSVVMKHSIVLLDQAIREHGLRSKKVLDFHDEAQFECLPEEAELHGQLAVQSIRDAGTMLGLNCPLDAEYKIGPSWRYTH